MQGSAACPAHGRELGASAPSILSMRASCPERTHRQTLRWRRISADPRHSRAVQCNLARAGARQPRGPSGRSAVGEFGICAMRTETRRSTRCQHSHCRSSCRTPRPRAPSLPRVRAHHATVTTVRVASSNTQGQQKWGPF